MDSPISQTSSTSPITIQRSQHMLTPEPSPPFFNTPIFGATSTYSNHLQLQCECFRQVPTNMTSSYTVPVLKIQDSNSDAPKRAEEYVDINLTSLDEAIKKEASMPSFESLVSAAPTLPHEAPKHKAHVIHIHKHYPHPQYSQSTVAPNRLLQPYPSQQFTRPTFRPRTTSDASEASLSSSASSATLCLQDEFILNKTDDKMQHSMDESSTRRNSINSLNSSLNPETLASSACTLPMEHTFHSGKEKLQFLGSANIMTHTLTGSNSENSLLQMPSLSLKEAHYQESGFSMS
ncbi:hypothetical protein BKA69DRAFT_531492 [Paraphysoderma sedebokerense]|nr:hypothetical protein BKA69DRAFT_531492 [Paraphysoderma sedebokerense]